MIHRSTRLLSAIALVLALPAFAADTYKIDSVHSEVGFRIRHLVAKTGGRFLKFEGTIVLDEAAPHKSAVTVSIDAASINTDNEGRDKHLKSDAFFDVAKYPAITFTSTGVKEVAKGKLHVTGNFTMHGVTRSIMIPVSILGTSPGMKPGTFVAGFEGELEIKRSDYGITTYAGALGDEVKISLNVEADKI